LHAGDGAGFARQALALAQETADKNTLLVADAGCGHALRVRYPSIASALSPRVELLIERAAGDLGRLHRGPESPGDKTPIRYHDPCLLGRGLGVYEAPRAVLTRALGRAPDEFDARREHGHCSGAGGALGVTMPKTASAIAKARVREHADEGGGIIVTACASSLLALRSAGAKVSDMLTVIARSVPTWRP
jgi:Fe-S oxidoreductase